MSEKGVTWDFDGDYLTYKWALAVAYVAGFRGMRLVRAVALMNAESGRWTRAWHKNIVDGEEDSIDRGLFQINSKWHPDLGWPACYHPVKNSKYAYKISSQGQFFKPWAAFGGARYLAALPIVAAAYALPAWRERVARVEERWPA